MSRVLLGGYSSSEDDDGDDKQDTHAQVKLIQTKDAAKGSAQPPAHLSHQDATPPGPAPGPSMPPPPDLEDSVYQEDAPPQHLSPEAQQEAVRNLTMPPFPNFSIPPSPPGSPPPSSTKKFANFLKLKKQGLHFNQRLASTPALKNPTLFHKLRQHAGISEEEQYATTLSEELAVPSTLPPWAYADELNKSQVRIRDKRDRMRKKDGARVEFVGALGSGASSRTSTPRAGGMSTSERVLGGVSTSNSIEQGRKR